MRRNGHLLPGSLKLAAGRVGRLYRMLGRLGNQGDPFLGDLTGWRDRCLQNKARRIHKNTMGTQLLCEG